MWVGRDSRVGAAVWNAAPQRGGLGGAPQTRSKDKTCSGLCCLFSKCRSVGEPVGGKVLRQSTCSVSSLFSVCGRI